MLCINYTVGYAYGFVALVCLFEIHHKLKGALVAVYEASVMNWPKTGSLPLNGQVLAWGPEEICMQKTEYVPRMLLAVAEQKILLSDFPMFTCTRFWPNTTFSKLTL